MTWLNEYEVQDAADRFGHGQAGEALQCASLTLQALVQWTNESSDGWPYWRKPANAAKALCAIVGAALAPFSVVVSNDDVRKAQRPIKAFRTRQGADFVIFEPCKGECGA